MAVIQSEWAHLNVQLDVVGWINGSGSISAEMEGSRASDFISVTPGEEYQIALVVPAGKRTWTRCCYYDSSKAFLGEIWYMSIYTIYNDDRVYNRSSAWTAPEGAAFARLSTLHVANGGGVDLLVPGSGGGGSMPSEVTLPLNDVDAWRNGTINQSMAAGSSYETVFNAYTSGQYYETRIRTVAPVPTCGVECTLVFSSGYLVWVGAFDENGLYLGPTGHSNGWKTSPYTFSFDGAEYIGIAARNSSNTNIVPSDADDMDMTLVLAGGGWLND